MLVPSQLPPCRRLYLQALERSNSLHAPQVAVGDQASVVGLVADLGAIGQRHDRRLECGSASCALAGCGLDWICRTPQPKELIEGQLVGVGS